MSERISQKQIDELIEDASYLQDEAEALKYVIDQVPYGEGPPDGRSIAEMLLLIDHAQLSYFRPVLKDAVENPRPTHIENFDYFEDTFAPDEKKSDDIQNLLSKLAKHRASVINNLKSISLIDWNTAIYSDEQEILLFYFVREMVQFDRKQLRKIAELVRAFHDQKRSSRELDRKRSMQNPPSDNPT
jgi:hypothetical protein